MRIEKYGYQKFAIRLHTDKYIDLDNPHLSKSEKTLGTLERCKEVVSKTLTMIQ